MCIRDRYMGILSDILNPKDMEPQKNEGEECYESWEEFFIDSCRSGELEDIKEALSNEADVNFVGAGGNNALHMAGANGHAEVVKFLITKVRPETINSPNEAGNTPLHWAIINNKKDIVQILVENGADCNLKNSNGERPIDLALTAEYLEIAELLAPKTKLTAEEIKEEEKEEELYSKEAEKDPQGDVQDEDVQDEDEVFDEEEEKLDLEVRSKHAQDDKQA
eukprot:TRINITY_DN3040_c0_g1_i1.p1 TRINITY_DN3040_c0_g1~~TRINITY_DN3040_c0_g1_i1.p1  ORF type:complete len:238 (-),score=84.03 TRINITY_DN3040_c0_g1_i1:89-754(-)